MRHLVVVVLLAMLGSAAPAQPSRASTAGMRVTRHDGTSQHHLIGVRPDIPLT